MESAESRGMRLILRDAQTGLVVANPPRYTPAARPCSGAKVREPYSEAAIRELIRRCPDRTVVGSAKNPV